MGLLNELPPGDSLTTMVETTDRILNRLRRRTIVAMRRYEKYPSAENSKMYLSAAQEYFYMTFTMRMLFNFAARLNGTDEDSNLLALKSTPHDTDKN
jgi:hypothetical protein